MRLTLLFAFIATFFFTTDSFAQKRRMRRATSVNWTVLGSKHVSKMIERDVIQVGNHKGTFTKLKVKITGGKVFMKSMVVTYGNGTKDMIPLKHVFSRGAESRVIDLRGNKRVIQKIAFVYDRKNNHRKAKVWVAGRR